MDRKRFLVIAAAVGAVSTLTSQAALANARVASVTRVARGDRQWLLATHGCAGTRRPLKGGSFTPAFLSTLNVT